MFDKIRNAVAWLLVSAGFAGIGLAMVIAMAAIPY